MMACDFCGKTQHEVEKLVSGQRNVAICDECIALAADVISGKAQPIEQDEPLEKATP